MASIDGETRRSSSQPSQSGGLLTSLGFVVYAAIAWVPCVIGGVILGAAVGIPPAEEGVIQGRSLGLTAAFPEILVFTLLFLVLAYVAPALYLNRKGR